MGDCEIKRLWLILFVISSVCGQEKQDVLRLKDGSTYKGEYVTIDSGKVLFKPEGAYGAQPVKIKKIKTLELSDGRLLIRNGRKLISMYVYQALSIEEKAEADAKEDFNTKLIWSGASFITSCGGVFVLSEFFGVLWGFLWGLRLRL